MIARKSAKGFECIYVHWDGNLEDVGKTLIETFNSDLGAFALVALGDCSSVAGSTSIDDVTAFFRDRDEAWEDVKPLNFATLQEAINFYGNKKFNYIWEDNGWTAYDGGGQQIDW